MTRKAATNMTMPSALEISRQATLKPVTEIAAEAGLPPWLIEPYGEHVAKIDLKAIEELTDQPRARYVLVTAVTPTPTGWRLPVREARASAGAGFVYPICGDMRTMPGLTTHPAAEHIDIDADGKVVGLA
jgi:formyltetrahydrofolate synthetase